MAVASRRTVIVHGRFSSREHRLAAARDRRHGLQIMSFEQMAVQLAAGSSGLSITKISAPQSKPFSPLHL